MRVALELLSEGAGPDLCVVADHQRAGRGRLDRRWEAPPGASLLCTFALDAPTDLAERLRVPTALGLAALGGIKELTGWEEGRVGLKWPNDLVVAGAGPGGEDAKLGGLLSEVHRVAGSDRLLVGLGVNLSWAESRSDLPAGATSLDLVGEPPVERDPLLERVAALFDDFLGGIEDGVDLADAYRRVCRTLGRRIRVEVAGGVFVGTAVGVTDAGGLEVALDTGEVREFLVGDVTHVRPGGPR